MKLVIIESPYAANRLLYLNYLERACLDSIKLGESPFAANGFYTIFLDDTKPVERITGMNCGWGWMAVADLIAVYIDYDISYDMRQGIKEAGLLKKEIVYRKIGLNPHV